MICKIFSSFKNFEAAEVNHSILSQSRIQNAFSQTKQIKTKKVELDFLPKNLWQKSLFQLCQSFVIQS
jgi:hypothetical protein